MSVKPRVWTIATALVPSLALVDVVHHAKEHLRAILMNVLIASPPVRIHALLIVLTVIPILDVTIVLLSALMSVQRPVVMVARIVAGMGVKQNVHLHAPMDVQKIVQVVVMRVVIQAVPLRVQRAVLMIVQVTVPMIARRAVRRNVARIAPTTVRLHVQMPVAKAVQMIAGLNARRLAKMIVLTIVLEIVLTIVCTTVTELVQMIAIMDVKTIIVKVRAKEDVITHALELVKKGVNSLVVNQ